ncbi:regulator of G-protein signaling 4-like isoform X1 [Carcharodon carcharias]|uniref:regulator of G-protein signaling 4-like isoform X1 n=1 Tax=Carcharodon carcharias TaxID=13397 RepID=UPI001B7D9143|nr:regulator of G-protein signaling 4-like isoform X1 [Carcharodon carcharias]
MCKGLATLPASCLERAKEVGTRLSILLLKSESSVSRSERKTRIPGRSHADEAPKWGGSLDTLLEHKRGVAAFRSFLRSEFSEENIDFWLACEEYKNTKTSSKLTLKAQKIYDEFVRVQAPKEVNLDSHSRESVHTNMTNPSLSCFDPAQKRIYGIMEKDSFPRFLKSQFYLGLFKQA